MWDGGAWDSSEVRSEMSVEEGQRVSQGRTWSWHSCHTGDHAGPEEPAVPLWTCELEVSSHPSLSLREPSLELPSSPSIRELSLSLTAGGMFTRNCPLSLSTSSVSSPSDFSMSCRVSLRDRFALDTPLI